MFANICYDGIMNAESKNNVTRRDFLKSLVMMGISVSTLAGCITNTPSPNTNISSHGDDDKSIVVIAKSNKLANPNRTNIKYILDLALTQVLGVDSADIAWKKLFKPNDIVGIKVNCISPIIKSTPQVSYAIADSLVTAGIPPEQIIIWDREDRELSMAGYTLNFDGPGVKCYGTKPRVGYAKELTISGSVGSRLSNILSRQCTATVNVPVLKDHNISGLSMSLKNYFGAIENPNKFHDNHCNPYVADLYMSSHIKDKNKLIICDAINILFEGGPTDCKPEYISNFNGLIIGTDPVAVDEVAWLLLEEKRSEAGLPSLMEAGRLPQYILTAADPEHKLGFREPDKIKVVEISDI